MDHDQTRALFAPLISKPTLTDQLLNRPPFKFLLDVFTNTITKTGFLRDQFPASSLDASNLGDKSAKGALLDALIAAVNEDGTLDDVKSSKIIAGKDPELTAKFLQRFAERAASAVPTNGTTKERAKSKERSKEKSNGTSKDKEKRKSKKDEDKPEKKEKVSSKDKDKEKKTKDKDEKKKDKDKDKDKKEKKPKSEKKDKEKSEKKTRDSSAVGRRESVTQVKGRDSLTIEDNDEVVVDTRGGPLRVNDASHNGFHEEEVEAEAPSPRPPPPAERERLLRQSTGTARPQTSMGRPGTAAARAAPPKLRKKHIATTDDRPPEVVESSADIIVEAPEADNAAAVIDDFLDELEENIPPELKEEIEVPEDEEERGGLVKKIMEKRAEIEEGAGATEIDNKDDDGDMARHKNQVAQIQEQLQGITRTAFPLARLFDYAQEDFETMVRELERWRSETKKYEQVLTDGKAVESYATKKESSQLKTLMDDIREVKATLMAVKARIISNDENVKLIISNM